MLTTHVQAEEIEATIATVRDAVERGAISWKVPERLDFFQRYIQVVLIGAIG